jgi:hypothetical protein
MEHLWQVLLRAEARAETLSCEECFILMDYLADLLAEGQRPEVVRPLAERYLQRCPGCTEEVQRTIEDLLLVSLSRPRRPDAHFPGPGHD